MRWITIAVLCWLLTGCIRIINVPDYSGQPTTSAAEQPQVGEITKDLSTPKVSDSHIVGRKQILKSGLYTMPLLVQPGASLHHIRIYIETNKYGWLKKDTRLVKGLGYQLYKQDSQAIYAEYPCYSQTGHFCNTLYRDGQRFSTEQAGAVASMLAQFKRESAAETLEVVAVGDAAALMLKVAALTDVIDHLHSINGTLSPALWAQEINQPPPLSSDPLIYHRKLQHLAQTHWIANQIEGAEELAQAYKDSFEDGNCVRIRLVNGSYSLENWRNMWPLLVSNRFRCESY